MARRTKDDLINEIVEALAKIRETLTEEEEGVWDEAVTEAASDEVDGGLVRPDRHPYDD